MWAVSGIYLVFPHPFSAVVDYLDPLDPQSFAPRRGDVALEWLAKLHFGRFAGVKTKALWAFMGLIPPALFVTGALMWWNRVLRPVALRRAASVRLKPDASEVEAVTTTEAARRVLQ
jgi:uncharacterized iron-regulated membrane protein